VGAENSVSSVSERKEEGEGEKERKGEKRHGYKLRTEKHPFKKWKGREPTKYAHHYEKREGPKAYCSSNQCPKERKKKRYKSRKLTSCEKKRRGTQDAYPKKREKRWDNSKGGKALCSFENQRGGGGGCSQWFCRGKARKKESVVPSRPVKKKKKKERKGLVSPV